MPNNDGDTPMDDRQDSLIMGVIGLATPIPPSPAVSDINAASQSNVPMFVSMQDIYLSTPMILSDASSAISTVSTSANQDAVSTSGTVLSNPFTIVAPQTLAQNPRVSHPNTTRRTFAAGATIISRGWTPKG